MNENELRNILQKNRPEPPEGFDGHVQMQLARLIRKEKKTVKRKVCLVMAAVMVIIIGVTTALAAFNDDVNQLLYQIWPKAAQTLKPISLTCEDQGIRMEVVSATLNGQEALVTLTVQDLENDRIDETADLFDSAILQLPYDGSGTCMNTGFDPETGIASFAAYMKFEMDGQPAGNDKVTFRVSQILSHKKEQTIDLTPLIPGTIGEAESMPVPAIRGWSGLVDTDGYDEASDQAVRAMKVLNTENSLEIPVTEGVTLTGVGIIDGVFHVQIRYTDIRHTDNHGFITLSDREGNEVYQESSIHQKIGSISWFGGNNDSWEEYIYEEYPEDLTQIVLQGDFITAQPAVEGDWHVTFPLSVIQEE